MLSRNPRYGISAALALAICLGAAASALAAPRIANVSLRGLQAGGLTTLVIDGSELLPDPKLWFSAPVAKQTIKEGATAQRLEVELALDGQTPSGIYLLRVASASGISQPVALAVDNLPQMPFAPQLAALNVAMTGALEGSAVLTSSFVGKQGQQVVVEVEARRLGSNLNPVVHLYDARRVQLAWSQALPALAGDARFIATLPADGRYTIELHDSLYRGGSPGFFRLKVGQLQLRRPGLSVGRRTRQRRVVRVCRHEFARSARASAAWPIADGRSQIIQPAPWPADGGLLSGSRPVVRVSNHAEIVEPAAGDNPADKLPEISAAPVAINGRIDKPGQHDRFRLAVTPGQKLRFDVLARRAGSALDGVLSIQNEQGAELAANDDRPDTTDPGLDFTVPEAVNAVVVSLRDLEGRGGADFVYRIAVTPIGQPDFSLSLADDRLLVPNDGAALARVRIDAGGLQRTDQAELFESADERRRSRATRFPPAQARRWLRSLRPGVESRAIAGHGAGPQHRREHCNHARRAAAARHCRPSINPGWAMTWPWP